MTEFQELVKDAPKFVSMEHGELSIYAYAMYAAGTKTDAENTNLRERITTQKQTIQAYRDESREWREVAERVQAENAKLRELARELWDQAEQNLVCDENCPYGAACDWMESDVVCVFKRRMRELGVEVDG